MNRPRLLCLSLLLGALASTQGESPSKSALFQDPAALDAMRAAWAGNTPNTSAAKIVERADAFLKKKIPLITDKEKAATSGDKRDYYSIGIYWWPNPITGGMPYIQRDGKFNPESNQYDRPRLGAFSQGALDLALAYWITRDPRYSARARDYFRAWFIDPETRMHPNFRHAQAWPGWTDGTPTGIIEGAAFAREAPDAVFLLHGAGGLPEDEYAEIRRWFAELDRWLEESPSGKEIAKANNNHGSWYDVQRASYQLFLGNTAKAKAILTGVGPHRIARQIEPDGKQPAELKRTKAFDYSCYNLSALLLLAELGDRAGVDLWHYESPDGASLRKALDFLIPYAKKEKPWPYKQLKGVRPSALATLLRRAAPAYPDAGYLKIAESLAAKP